MIAELGAVLRLHRAIEITASTAKKPGHNQQFVQAKDPRLTPVLVAGFTDLAGRHSCGTRSPTPTPAIFEDPRGASVSGARADDPHPTLLGIQHRADRAMHEL